MLEVVLEAVVTVEVGGRDLLEVEVTVEVEGKDLLVELVPEEVAGEAEMDLLEVLEVLEVLEGLEGLEVLDQQVRTGTVRGTGRTVAVRSRERGGTDWEEITERQSQERQQTRRPRKIENRNKE